MDAPQSPLAPPTYSDSKILFVSNNVGSSIARINAISLVSIGSYALYAAGLRYLSSAAISSGHPVEETIREWYHHRRDNLEAYVKVAALEYGVFVVPLLLSVTFVSGTTGALGLSLLMGLLAGVLFHQARKRESPQYRPPPDKGHATEPDATSMTATVHHTDKTSLRQRHTGTSQRNRSYSQSDDEEREVEAIERSDIRREQARQRRALASPASPSSDTPMIRVSVEAASEQAWNEAQHGVGYSNAFHPRALGFGPDDEDIAEQVSFEPSPASPLSRGWRPDESDEDSDDAPSGSARASASVPASATSPSSPSPSRRHDAFVTIYRSHMMLITIVCILAVDFPVFDRLLGKCETWGTSLMDMGVGSFVFSLGIISAGPYLRPTRPPLVALLQKDIRKSLPLFALGLIRVISVKMTSYPEHVSEYGVHWNFFLTLAVLPLLKTVVEGARRLTGGRWSTWGFIIATTHQILLTWTDLQRWVLGDTPRTAGLVSANREGISSLPGYLAILLLSIDLGMYILPEHDPYRAFRKAKITGRDSDQEAESSGERRTPRHSHTRQTSDGQIDTRHATRQEHKRFSSLTAILASWALVYWAVYFICIGVMGGTQATSRRLANVPYVLWVAAFNTTFLLGYACVYWAVLLPLKDLTRHSQVSHKPDDTPQEDSDSPYGSIAAVAKPQLPLTPPLMESINTHSFALFLVANVLTGCVNLVIHTMYVGDVLAVMIIAGYVGVCLALVGLLERRGR